MELVRSGLAFLVVLVLTLALVSGNVATAADRTVMNEEFVTTTLEEEETYRTAQSIVAEEAESRIVEVEDSIPVPVDPERAANETITRRYLKNQTEANVNRTFRFLNGETEKLELRVVLTPVKDNVADFAGERIRELTVAELIDVVTESRELTVEIQNVTFDLRIISRMSEGPESYREARESFREDVRQVGINRLVEEVYETRSPDELLLLIDEDPRQYNETEKERIVAEREDEIKTELEAAIRDNAGDEIEARVNRQLEETNEVIESDVDRVVEENLAEQYRPAAEPASDLLMVGVRGLTTNMTYETFDAELSTAKANLADNVSTVVRDVLAEEFPERLDLTANLSEGAETRLDQAREANGFVGLLGVLLPIVAILLIGLLYLITRSIAGTAFSSGVALVSAGASGFLVGEVTPGIVESQVRSELSTEDVPEDAIDVAIGFVEQVFGALAAQSLVLAVLGVALVAAGLYLRYRADSDESAGADATGG